MSSLRHVFGQELRLSFASLMRLPSFSFTVIATLAVTLAALAVVLNINYLVLTKPLPYPDAETLVVTDQSETINGDTQYGFQLLPTQFHIYSDTTYIEEMALMSISDGKLRDIEGTPFIDGLRVSPEYFSLLNTPMLLGRYFNKNEGVNDQQSVAVLSAKTWQEHFKSEPAIIGQFTRIGNQQYKIIGVAAPSFSDPEVFGHTATEVWMSFSQEISTTQDWDSITGGINGIARLKAGIAIKQANMALGEQINDLYQSQEGVAPDTSIGARFVPLKTKIIDDSDTMALMLLAGVITLLFIAVTNITNLFFSRAAEKQRVMAIQAAVGAQPKHLFASMFAEAFLLISAAWVIGLVLSGWIMLWLENDLQYMFPRMQNLQLDAVTVVASGIVSLLIALIMAKLAVKQVNYSKLIDDLHGSGKGTGAQISAFTRNLLVATQVSLATVLILGAIAVLSPVFDRLAKPVGFNSDLVTYLRVDSGAVEEGVFEYAQQIKQKLANLPEVQGVARALSTPLAMGWKNYLYDSNNKMLGIVSTGMYDQDFFSVLEHPILAGRSFSDITNSDAIPQEIIISESLAKRVFGNKPAIGQILQAAQNEPLTVVGVVGDIRVPDIGYDYELERYYLPYPGDQLSFTIKLNAPLARAKILNVLTTINPNFSISRIYDLDWALERRLREAKLVAILTVSLVLLALTLAAAGIYGVLSYAVQMRRYELGIHLALGAHTHSLISMVVKQSMMPVCIGILSGLVIAVMAHLIGSQLWVYELRANMLSFAFALPLMGVIAVIACYWPVKKVITADPIKALRNE